MCASHNGLLSLFHTLGPDVFKGRKKRVRKCRVMRRITSVVRSGPSRGVDMAPDDPVVQWGHRKVRNTMCRKFLRAGFCYTVRWWILRIPVTKSRTSVPNNYRPRRYIYATDPLTIQNRKTQKNCFWHKISLMFLCNFLPKHTSLH
jgi:hypothetical protein